MVSQRRPLILLFAALFACLITASAPPPRSATKGSEARAPRGRASRLTTRLAADPRLLGRLLRQQKLDATLPPPRLGPSATPYRTTRGPGVALTFDDGPDPRWTPRVLALLRRYRVKATFCLIGALASKHPELVRQIAADGHRLCNHTMHHDLRLRRRSPRQIGADLALTNLLITKAGVGTPRYFRAPGGNWSPTVIAAAQKLGMRPLGWSTDPQDWRKPPTRQLVACVRANTRAGSIVLLHDAGGDRSHTYAALGTLLPDLHARFTLIPL
jgi:peptidoglycan/xylan/chitin deacetylase (PgdA/CDA1 family)